MLWKISFLKFKYIWHLRIGSVDCRIWAHVDSSSIDFSINSYNRRSAVLPQGYIAWTRLMSSLYFRYRRKRHWSAYNGPDMSINIPPSYMKSQRSFFWQVLFFARSIKTFWSWIRCLADAVLFGNNKNSKFMQKVAKVSF